MRQAYSKPLRDSRGEASFIQLIEGLHLLYNSANPSEENILIHPILPFHYKALRHAGLQR